MAPSGVVRLMRATCATSGSAAWASRGCREVSTYKVRSTLTGTPHSLSPLSTQACVRDQVIDAVR